MHSNDSAASSSLRYACEYLMELLLKAYFYHLGSIIQSTLLLFLSAALCGCVAVLHMHVCLVCSTVVFCEPCDSEAEKRNTLLWSASVAG